MSVQIQAYTGPLNYESNPVPDEKEHPQRVPLQTHFTVEIVWSTLEFYYVNIYKLSTDTPCIMVFTEGGNISTYSEPAC